MARLFIPQGALRPIVDQLDEASATGLSAQGVEDLKIELLGLMTHAQSPDDDDAIPDAPAASQDATSSGDAAEHLAAHCLTQVMDRLFEELASTSDGNDSSAQWLFDTLVNTGLITRRKVGDIQVECEHQGRCRYGDERLCVCEMGEIGVDDDFYEPTDTAMALMIKARGPSSSREQAALSSDSDPSASSSRYPSYLRPVPNRRNHHDE